MSGVVHRAASSKGGRLKKTKGIGSLDAARRKEIASMGGKARRENKGIEKQETVAGDGRGLLERVLGDVDEEII